MLASPRSIHDDLRTILTLASAAGHPPIDLPPGINLDLDETPTSAPASPGPHPMTTPRPRLLFLCTGNSARSILAEAIASVTYGHAFDAASAGSTPKGEPNPLALNTLARHGLPTDRWRSQSWNEFTDGAPFDLVITLCDSAARETCPVLPGGPPHVHWGFPDPPAAEDPEALFELVYLCLVEALGLLAKDDGRPLPDRAGEVALLVAAKFPGAARAAARS